MARYVPVGRKLEIRQCVQCGTDFEVRMPHQGCCSKRCRNKKNWRPASQATTAAWKAKNAEKIKSARRSKRQSPGEKAYRNWYARVTREKSYTGSLEEYTYHLERRALELKGAKQLREAKKKVRPTPKYAGMTSAEVWRHKYRANARFNAWERHRNQFKKWMRGGTRTNTIARTVGYTRDDLLRHLEAQFTKGMSWNNKGQWHIDHIKPKNLFDPTNPDDMRACWSLSNLRPLWGSDNCRRPRDGSDVLV